MSLPPVLTRRPFVFLRHGQSTRNHERRIGGQQDVGLTQRGREEARYALDLLGAIDWSLAVSSPLARARETAELALGRAPDRLDARLMERHWGEFEGQPIPARLPYLDTPAGGESWTAFVDRIVAGLNDALNAAERPLIVGHSGLIRVIRWIATGTPEGPRSGNAVPLLMTPEGDRGWEIRPFASQDASRL
ncbi:histidine phosphatase family protein [Salinicola aestuarinus]|uniref:histidine phosphatase family protein n=1 Tax=Salinicola aestuarinus TaxID=1949082 RepID=UPI000DA1CB20|nr:histidine phosphatase family protein [Salinicola aestuarinus]